LLIVQVVEITSSVVFDKACEGSDAASQLCFLAFLPDILDTQAAGRNRYISVLKLTSEKFKDRPFSYIWAAAGKQADLEAKFGIGGFGYPALVAYSPKRGVYVPMREALEEGHMQEFVQSIRTGTRGGAPVQDVLSTVQSSEAWDGKDGEIVAEEEFSLDDIMGQEL
jgi:protein disulfide-isomerase A6